MTDKIFVDTNILIYARDLSVLSKQTKAAEWLLGLWENRNGRISYQVLSEFYVNVTQKLKPGLTKEEAREDIIDLLSWNPVALNEKILIQTWEIQDNYRISFWDSLILATAKVQECRFLLSEDFSAATEYSGIKIVNPFQTTLSDLQ